VLLLAALAAAAPTIALRPGDPLPVLGPEARVDLGLRAAAEELAGSATSLQARLSPGAIRIALSRAGYPGAAHFLLARGGATPPPDLLAALPYGQAVDVGWATRSFDGANLWILGWAPRRLSVDPLARDVHVGGGLSLRVDGATEPRLLVAAPGGGVREVGITDGVARRIRFDTPGEHRVEVIDGDRVELLFSVFADTPVPAAALLPGPAAPADPTHDLPYLYGALDRLRAAAGLPPLTPFPAFEPHARAHASCVATAGVVAHRTPTCPGVPELARRTHHPRARHTEDVAAGGTSEEAWQLVTESPGHQLNLLCAECTHVAIGAVASDGRVYVVWELLTFPDGTPQALPEW
jgi:hypothetical protein